MVFIKAFLFSAAAFILSKAINPVLKFSAKNHEILLLVSISFLFLFVLGSFLGGLSLAIGAFFAGLTLANSDFKTEIEGKISPLREFFAVIFFVALGMQLRIITLQFLWVFLILLALIIIIKPFIVMFLVRGFGYKKSTSFLTGNSLAHTSEFSLIIVTLGLTLGKISPGLFSTLVLLTILTMSSAAYMINYEKKLFKWFGWPLRLLNKEEKMEENLEYHEHDGKKIVIFGCHRMGSLFVKEFEKNKKEIFVVDYNPEIIKSLINKKIPCIYGDFANEEVFERIDIKKAKIVISTIPDLDDNLVLIKKIRETNKNALIFIVAERISEAISLYKKGADYVILPQVIGGQKVSEIIKKVRGSKEEIKKLKKDHVKYLDSIHNILY
jgi:FlaA1/EpsC-like NDP-sugar epimerase